VAKTRESHPIPDEKLSKYVAGAEQYLRAVNGKLDLLEIFQQLSQEERYRPLPAELNLFYAIRRALCIRLYLIDELLTRTGYADESGKALVAGAATTQSLSQKGLFISAYSFFVMASSIATHCEKMLNGKSKDQLANLQDIDALELTLGKGFEIDLRFLLHYYVDAISSSSETGNLVQSADDMVAITLEFWKAIAKKSAAAAEQVKDLLPLVEGVTFHHGRFAVTGLAIEKQRESALVTWTPVQPNEVVGDPEVTTLLRRQCDRVALYDPTIQKNPFCEYSAILESILFDGNPGTGKTRRQLMVLTLLAMRAEQVGVILRSKSLTADQIKSEWYGKTSQLLKECLEYVMDPSSISCFFIDDIDLLLAGDRDAGQPGGADKDILKGLMDYFSGVGTKFLGNSIALAATNKPTAADGALRQRFVYRAIINGPVDALDFTDLAALELRKFAKTGLLKIGEGKYKPLSRMPQQHVATASILKSSQHVSPRSGTFEDIGNLCSQLHGENPRFTGRSVKNAIQVAVAEASDFDIPENWFTDPTQFRALPWEDRLAKAKTLFSEVSADDIMRAIESQFQSEERYVREEKERQIEKKAEEILTYETASERAVQNRKKTEA
jgi:hypothetical protein